MKVRALNLSLEMRRTQLGHAGARISRPERPELRQLSAVSGGGRQTVAVAPYAAQFMEQASPTAPSRTSVAGILHASNAAEGKTACRSGADDRQYLSSKPATVMRQQVRSNLP